MYKDPSSPSQDTSAPRKPARKPTKSSRSSVRTKKQKPDAPTAITTLEYGGLQIAYDHFNRVLFDGKLPDCFITYVRQSHMRGHFWEDRYSGRIAQFKKPELALNPDHFINCSDEVICSTLVHEQTHFWQVLFGNPGKRGYHNREWAAKMKSIGLQPSNTGAVGGRETGSQMTHYILPGGRFTQAFAELAASGWRLNLQSTIVAGETRTPPSKLKFTCSNCGANAWGKPDCKLACQICLIHSLADLPWIDRGRAEDLLGLIGRATMLSPRPDPDVAASSNGELAR